MIGISPFDILAFASFFGIIGGTLGFLWKPKSTHTSFKPPKFKYNLLGVTSAIIAFNCLALPWWVWTYPYHHYWHLLFPWGFEAFGLDRLLGRLWGELNTPAMYAVLALILISGVLGLLGSLVFSKRGRILLILAGIFGLLSVSVFGIVLATFPWYTLPGIRGMFYSTWSTLAYLSFGFWTALAASILAFIAALRHTNV